MTDIRFTPITPKTLTGPGSQRARLDASAWETRTAAAGRLTCGCIDESHHDGSGHPLGAGIPAGQFAALPRTGEAFRCGLCVTARH